MIESVKIELHESFVKGVQKCREYIVKFQPHRALEHVALLSSKVNKYIDTCLSLIHI